MPDDTDRPPLTYRDAGVDIDKGDSVAREVAQLAHSTYGPRVISGVGGFASLFRLDGKLGLFRKKYRDPLLVACTDGVGTKLHIAFATGRHDTVGIDLVAMSVNDLLTVGAEPLFFLDYFVTGRLEEKVMLDVVKGISEGCLQAGCALLGGETAEHPGDFPDGHYDLAGFCVGVADRSRLFDKGGTTPGDTVIGIGSSGLHSNGFSLARKALFERAGMSVGDAPDELDGRTIGEELLTPTRIYASAIEQVLGRYKVKEVIRGVAHITGGGLPGNIPRILPSNVDVELKRESLKTQPIFGVIQKAADISDEEMFRVFNMGVGMVIICSSYYAGAIVRTLRGRRAGRHDAYVIGRVVEGEGKVRII